MPTKKLYDLTDEQLMKLYQNGDEEAFKALYVCHSPKVYGFLKSRIQSKEKVSEVFQEVFIKIHKSKHLYNDSLPVLPWIFTITKTVMIDELRRDKNLKTTNDYDLDKVPAPVESVPAGVDQALEMLGQLPEQQKAAVELRYVSDNTFEQIAASLKVSPANARQIVSRGIKRLRELISDKGDS